MSTGGFIFKSGCIPIGTFSIAFTAIQLHCSSNVVINCQPLQTHATFSSDTMAMQTRYSIDANALQP